MNEKNFTDKLNELLQQHFNLYHTDCIVSMLYDESVSVEEFAKKVRLIAMCEENDIDEYDSINKYYILIDEDGKPVINDYGTLYIFDNMEEAYAESEEYESVIYLPTFLKINGII